jgi:uncharacterized membrane protein YhhN
MRMSAESTLASVSAVASAGYGAWFVAQPISGWRTLVKTAAVGGLAVLAYVSGAPFALTMALVLSAAGDAFLAGDSERWLPAGLGAFLFAHVSYIALFVHDGGGRAALIAEPVRTLGVAAAFAAGVTLLAWLWRGLGPMRGAVVAYAGALCLMTASSFTLPYRLWPAMLGSVLFTASDGLLSAELFKGIRTTWSPHVVWGLYYAAQALIVWAYLR